MTVPWLVDRFYRHIWNAGDLSVFSEILTETFLFRGSLGTNLKGHDAFREYVTMVRGALADYRCDILECVSEGDRAFAKMEFSGRHVGSLRGFAPTGETVQWLGAALFRFESDLIAEAWVLGDLAGLDAVLTRNRERRSSSAISRGD